MSCLDVVQADAVDDHLVMHQRAGVVLRDGGRTGEQAASGHQEGPPAAMAGRPRRLVGLGIMRIPFSDIVATLEHREVRAARPVK